MRTLVVYSIAGIISLHGPGRIEKRPRKRNMSFLKKLTAALGGGSSSNTAKTGGFYEFKVRCRRCGEEILGRINLNSDLSIDYERGGYFVRKLVSGSGANRCFQQIEVQFTFDGQKQLVDRGIVGGTFADDAVATALE